MNNYYGVIRSPDYLEHFGILGMKWGIRRYQNPDGSLTPEGRERYRVKNERQADKLKEEYEKMFNWKNRDEKNLDKMFEMTGASEEILKEVKEVSKEYAGKLEQISKEADTLFKDFDKETKTFYEAASELAEHSLINSRDPEDSSLEDIGWAGFMGCLEDGQQQSINANSMYTNEKDFTDSCAKLYEEYDKAWKDYHEQVRPLVSKAFEDVGADIQMYDKNPNYKLGEAVADNHAYAIEQNRKGDHFYQALDGHYKYNSDETKAVNSAKEIISKIEGHKDYNTWWYFNDAAENLGMSNIKASEMTQADWDRLNAEIRNLRSAQHSAMTEEEYLEHHGILGQKWGIRRYQNPDGSLTPEGRARYGDILTPDQMKNYIRSYNLRTGKNKKLNKKTVFKTPNGLYDYKGKKLNSDTDVEDHDNGKENKKTDSKTKKISEMTDEELKTATARMSAELDYIDKYNKLHPKKVTIAEKLINNFRNSLVDKIPDAVAQNIINSMKSSNNSGNDKKKNSDKQGDNKRETSDNQSKPNSNSSGINKDELSKMMKDAASNAVKAYKDAEAKAAANNNSKVPTRTSSSYNSNNSNAMNMFGYKFSSNVSSKNVDDIQPVSDPSRLLPGPTLDTLMDELKRK